MTALFSLFLLYGPMPITTSPTLQMRFLRSNPDALDGMSIVRWPSDYHLEVSPETASIQPPLAYSLEYLESVSQRAAAAARWPTTESCMYAASTAIALGAALQVNGDLGGAIQIGLRVEPYLQKVAELDESLTPWVLLARAVVLYNKAVADTLLRYPPSVVLEEAQRVGSILGEVSREARERDYNHFFVAEAADELAALLQR